LRYLIALPLLLAALLQAKAWFSDVGARGARALRAELEAQQRRTAVLESRNRLLTAEVLALQDGLEVVESRARNDLGMIREGETFYLVPDAR